MWYLYPMEFYSAIKNNEILSFAHKWMELENIILSEVSQVQKPKATCFLSYVEYKQYYIYIQIYTEHILKSGTCRGDYGRRKRRKG
jgi:hypothetical protein